MKEFEQIENQKAREQLSAAFNIAVANRKRNKTRREVAKYLNISLETVVNLENKQLFDFNLVANYIRYNNVELGIFVKISHG